MTKNSSLPVITISRQYGAGGRSLAKGLSEKLGIKYYDIDFVRLTAKVSGFSEEQIIAEGEDMGKRAQFLNSFLTNASFSNPYDKIFQAQKAVILGLAENPCIIVGRCSNIILREEGIPSFDIFLTASLEYRVKWAAENGKHDGVDLEKYVEHRDSWRKNYYKAYTNHDLGEASDYHICLDTSYLGIDKCVDIVAGILNPSGKQ